MTLSTVDADDYPDARVLILKNVFDDKFYFATGLESRKGQQLNHIKLEVVCASRTGSGILARGYG